jgi:hypothetical protein
MAKLKDTTLVRVNAPLTSDGAEKGRKTAAPLRQKSSHPQGDE